MQLKKSKPPGLCDPKEIALKSFFLGPQAENASWVIEQLNNILSRWANWRRTLFPHDGPCISSIDQNSNEFIERQKKIANTLNDLLNQFEKEVPKLSPRYIGHMFSEISLPALFGHIITLLHNPNNISGESSRIGTRLEEEAIQFLIGMIGYSTDCSTGHFTSGGTIANFEALLRARCRAALWLSAGAMINTDNSFNPFIAAHSGWRGFDSAIDKIKNNTQTEIDLSKFNFSSQSPYEFIKNFNTISKNNFLGPVILAPENMHYSWIKGCRLLGLGTDSLWPIHLDRFGRLSPQHLKKLISTAQTQQRPILMIVSVLGTT